MARAKGDIHVLPPEARLLVMNDPFNLQRFVDLQAPIYDEVRRDLRRGRKESHWMWFIFPQIAGLGNEPDGGEIRHFLA